MNILWVCWLVWSMDTTSTWATKCLLHVGFYNSSDLGAFGFLDPEVIIRGVLLIPAFMYGQTSDLLTPHSITHQHLEDHKDWEWYYVNV
ncbi:hypothetical protein OG21DRAFT_1425539 [Imleria badia]|nr:hypothetical protein OG21DRAFT_1425539 [Imleria badia]